MTILQISDLTAVALFHAGMGTRVVPLRPGGKEPLLTGWPERATCDREQVEAWWDKWPDANVGGVLAGTDRVVLDVDCRDGKGGLRKLRELEREHWRLPSTRRVVTASGGLHYYFRGAARHGKNLLGEGLDVVSNGYVVLPGSVVKGKPYRFLDVRNPGALPEWLAALVAEGTSEPNPAPKDFQPNPASRIGLRVSARSPRAWRTDAHASPSPVFTPAGSHSRRCSWRESGGVQPRG